ncbi:MAG: hypothetical protein JW384_02572 [Nitrosomonadaceae bacterium]|nr:hypothetical protein [Nitrosomonadaceae bacterium]
MSLRLLLQCMHVFLRNDVDSMQLPYPAAVHFKHFKWVIDAFSLMGLEVQERLFSTVKFVTSSELEASNL